MNKTPALTAAETVATATRYILDAIDGVSRAITAPEAMPAAAEAAMRAEEAMPRAKPSAK